MASWDATVTRELKYLYYEGYQPITGTGYRTSTRYIGAFRAVSVLRSYMVQ